MSEGIATEQNTQVAEPEETISWQASEFIHHAKNPKWYLILGTAVLLLIAIMVWMQHYFGAVVIALMAVALAKYSNQQPRVLNYRISSKGIEIDDKLYSFKEFRSFAIFNDLGWHAIDLDSVKRFMPNLTILLENKDLEKITSVLASHLPKIEKRPDFIDNWTRKLKF